MKTVYFAIALALGSVAAPACAETLDNAAVITLLKAGLGDDVVIAKIKSAQVKFDVSTDTVIALKQQGVSGAVIAAMITANSAPPVVAMSQDSPDPAVPHPSGVYYLDGSGNPQRMQRLESTTTSQVKTGNLLGYALTSGISSLKLKGVINGETAALHISDRSPVFYFFFDQASQGFNAAGGTVTSPKELNLITLQVKSGRRETTVGSVNIGGAKTGLDEKGRIATEVTALSPGVYKVAVTGTLTPGEYGFATSPVGSGSNASFRVFDFSVK